MPSTNGLCAGSACFLNGNPDSYTYVRRDAGTGNTTVDGDMSVVGDLVVGGTSYLVGDVSTDGNIDLSGSTKVVEYNISGTAYKLYPSFLKITTAGAITKQATATEITESQYTVPLDGYYSYTLQVILGTVGTVADGDIMSLFADISGGALTPINGTVSIIDVAENSANSIQIALSGIIFDRLTAGQMIRFFHSESGTYTFSTGSVQVVYNYIGDQAL
jgi:hypothetical protein